MARYGRFSQGEERRGVRRSKCRRKLPPGCCGLCGNLSLDQDDLRKGTAGTSISNRVAFLGKALDGDSLRDPIIGKDHRGDGCISNEARRGYAHRGARGASGKRLTVIAVLFRHAIFARFLASCATQFFSRTNQFMHYGDGRRKVGNKTRAIAGDLHSVTCTCRRYGASIRRLGGSQRRRVILPRSGGGIRDAFLFLLFGILSMTTPATSSGPRSLRHARFLPLRAHESPRSLGTAANSSFPRDFVARMGMDIANCDVLEPNSTTIWELATSEFIFESLLLRKKDLKQLNVTSDVVEQLSFSRRLESVAPSLLGSNQPRREQAIQPLRLLFIVAVKFNSSSNDDFNVEQLILEAFETAEQRALYIFALQDTEDKSFSNVQKVTVFVRDFEDVGSQQTQEKDNTLLIIVAAVLGSISFLTFFGVVCYLRYASNKDKKQKEQTEFVTSPKLEDNDPDEEVMAVVETSYPLDSDAVSTLGGSVVSTGGLDASASVDTMRDEGVVFMGYDDGKLYRVKESGENAGEDESTHRALSVGGESYESGSLHVTKESSIVSDDASFERQYCGADENNLFEVAAPSGKLGVIIDTPENSPPTVFAIKDTSPLAGVVMVGDQLVSVDGTETTEMSSVAVSQLLFEKAGNSTRVLAFHRTLGY